MMKHTIVCALAVAALGCSALQAQACNPMLNRNYGKHVAPTVLPASMLARNAGISAAHNSIVGLWHDVHTASDGTLFLEGYDTWNKDGTENELGNLPPATGALCVGVFTVNGRKVDLVTHVAWLYDTSNDFVGTLNITEENKVSFDGNGYSGTFDARFYNPSGALFHEVTGTTVADRLGQ